MLTGSATNPSHAIVIGGSMAGLLAARVLSDHFGEVTILERDTLPNGPEQRRGVPQGRHTHGLLASGSQVLERLFPGISAQLIERGALAADILRDGRWFIEGGCLARGTSGVAGLLMSRPFLESAVRERVLALPNVHARENTVVAGLAVEDGAVRGVDIGGDVIRANLAVDATGRGSKSAEWLGAMGYEKPPEHRVEIPLTYTTRFFRRRATDMDGDLVSIIPPTPEGKRGGVMLAQEGDRWTVTLIAYAGAAAPTDLAGFVEFARTLPAPYIWEVVRSAEPLDNGAGARFPASIRRRYERLRRFPGGYLVFGDAICSFNPIYGQGMSVAALEALELDTALRAGADALARRFFPRAAKVVDSPWSIVVGNDLRMPEAIGPRTAGMRMINSYMSRLHRAAHSDAAVAWAFHRVGSLLAPPPSVLHPRIAARVIAGNLRPRPKPEVAPPTAAAASGD